MIKDCFLEDIRNRLKLSDTSKVEETLEKIRRTGKALHGVTTQEAGKMLFLIRMLDNGKTPGGSTYNEFEEEV